MKHIVLFKFNKNENKEKIKNILSITYNKLKNTHNVIENYDFKFNCTEKENNMDLILFVYLGENNTLEDYILHPDHQAALKDLKAEGLCDKSVIDIND